MLISIAALATAILPTLWLTFAGFAIAGLICLVATLVGASAEG
ncbi:hypothetical protein [Sphingobium sp.]|nr:hypothetical protein [Sphingobium sp.]